MYILKQNTLFVSSWYITGNKRTVHKHEITAVKILDDRIM